MSKTRVTFYAEDGTKSRINLVFRSEQTAERFINEWQDFGGFNRFNSDIWGEEKSNKCARWGLPVVSNSVGTFKLIYFALYNREAFKEHRQ